MANYSEEERKMAIEAIYNNDGWEHPLATWFRCCAEMGMRPPPKAPNKKYIKGIENEEEWALRFYFRNRQHKDGRCGMDDLREAERKHT